MSTLERPPASDTTETPASVLAAVLVHRDTDLGGVLDAIAAQVYGPAGVTVVGGDEAARAVVEERGLRWSPSIQQLVQGLEPEIDHVWLLHGDARPRRDALAALVRDLERVDASVAGSKVLRADRPDVLESVGSATDILGEPYSGLEQDEVDQEQYDVVRDVAFVSGTSLLVRRDLLRGLGGPDRTMPPEASGIDFSQRARAAGGRVVVVPSSEVLHEGTCRATVPGWREQAGRVRALLKAYSLLTLSWVLPASFLIGLVAGLVRLFIGPRTALWDWVRAWVWSVGRLPSTLAARRAFRRARQTGDEELFRYQVRGSVVLRSLVADITERFHAATSEETGSPLAELVERSRTFWQQPAFLTTLFAAAFVVFAGRAVWFGGLPATGFALELPDSAWSTLRSYAGGWNPAGLGSPEPLHPAVGATSLLQLILLSRAGLTAAVLTAAGLLGGMVGMGRLLRRFGLGPTARLLAGLTLVAGPATQALMGEGYWPALMAVGAAPWAVHLVLAPWPEGLRRRLGRLAAAGLMTGWLAVFAPLALLLPLAAVLLWGILGDGPRWGALARAVPAGLLAVPFLFPWLAGTTLDRLLESGVAFDWLPSWWAAIPFVAAVGGAAVAGDERTSSLGLWGGVMALGGVLGSRVALAEAGREPAVAALVATALGSAVVVGAAVDSAGRLPEASLLRKGLAASALAGAVLLAAAASLVVVDGAVGLGEDRFVEQLDFAAALQGPHGGDRILMVGPPETLPGDARRADGYGYRVVSAPLPSLPEAWLSAPRLGDLELDRTLQEFLSAGTLRPGAALAPFGIRWVVATGPNPIESAFAGQLDLRRLPLSPSYTVYSNEAAQPRAVAEDGTPWSWDAPDYRGPARAGSRVYLAENGDQRWGKGWSQAGWANEVDGDSGVVSFGGSARFRWLAWAAGIELVLLAVAAVWWRR